MALRRRTPQDGAPDDTNIYGPGDLPGVYDTRAGLGGDGPDGVPGGPGGDNNDDLPPESGGTPPKSKSGVLTPHSQQGSEGPRENFGSRSIATPPSPQAPAPFSAAPGGGAVPPPPMAPFDPLPSNPLGDIISPGGPSPYGGPAAAGAGPQRRSLFGTLGGLKGGGLGVPLDPVSNASSDPIDSLLSSLQRRKPGLGSF